MKIELLPARADQQTILANLIELYSYDLTAIWPFSIGPEGRYGYSELPLYWSEPHRFPFLIYVEGELAGFALVQKGSPISDEPDAWDMAEFFILRAYRHQGVGSFVVKRLWDRFKGAWLVRVLPGNLGALSFWDQQICAYCQKKIEPAGLKYKKNEWLVYRFET